MTHTIEPRRNSCGGSAQPVKRHVLMCAAWILMTGFLHNSARSATPTPAPQNNPRVAALLAYLRENGAAITEDQVRITEIPAPTFQEAARAAYMKQLLAAAALRVETDSYDNVIGELPGASKDIVMVVAHMDTVFPPGTDVHVRRQKDRLLGPGISDNSAGLAGLVAIARAFREAKLKPRNTILFVADVGEEGEGNLRGMRALVDTFRKDLKYVIALDGSATEYVTTSALASRRVEITLTGPGGHSWSDFGAPNPIHALGRGIARFVSTPVPEFPRTSFNIGQIEGGTSVNSIPSRASIKVDLRSEAETEIAKLETALREAMETGVTAETAAARERGVFGRGYELGLKVTVLGVRPAGELAQDSPLLAALESADRQVGNRSRQERSSTDANIPLSLGIPAIAIGAGGHSGGAHTLEEWYDPSDREMGLQRVALTILGVAGVEP